MNDDIRLAIDWLMAHPVALIGVVAAVFVVVTVVPLLALSLVFHVAGRTIAGGLRGGPWLRGVTIVALAALLLGGLHLWTTRTSTPLLIYSEGPAPQFVEGAVYDLTLEPDGSLLVTEEFTVTLARDLRSPFRPLRRDQPATVLALSDDDRPISAQAWIGPQSGIRLGTGVTGGRHRYRLTYRLPATTKPAMKQPERICPPFSACTYLTDQREPLPVQRVSWRPLPWPVAGEMVVRWHFPHPYQLETLAALNARFTWAEPGSRQVDDRTVEVRRVSAVPVTPPPWLATLAIPEGMTEAGTLRPDAGASWMVAVLPLLALAGAAAVRLRMGGAPAGLATLKAEYQPPDGLPATALGRLVRARRPALVAAVLAAAASQGVMRVDALHRPRTGLPDQHDDEFTVTGSIETLPATEALFLRRLLHGQSAVRLSQLEGRLYEATEQLETDVQRALVAGGYFNRRREVQRMAGVALAFALGIGGPYVTFYLVNRFPTFLPVRHGSPAERLGFTEPVLAAWVLAALIVLFAALAVPTITRKGAMTRSRARGFAEYLRTAELSRIEHAAAEGHAPPLLPYALALDVSRELTERWQALAGAPDNRRGRRRTLGLGEAAFGDDGILRQPLLMTAGTVQGGEPG